MKIFKETIILVIFFFLMSYSCFAQTAEEHLKRGDGFVANKLIPEGIVELKKALALVKEDQEQLKAEILISLANSYNWKGTFNAAIAACKQALEINPNLANAHYNLGFAYREEGKDELSEKEFALSDNLLKKEGEYFEVPERPTEKDIEKHVALGDDYFKEGKLDEAIIEYEKAMDILPRNDIFNKLDQVHQQKRLANKTKEAPPEKVTHKSEKTLDRTSEITKSDKEASEVSINELLSKGISYYDEGMIDEAIEQFNQILEIDPGNAKANYNLGNTYADKGMFDEAISAYKKAVEKDTGLIDAYFNLSMLYLDMGLIDEAITLCKQAVEANPNDSFLCFHLGEAYTRNKQYKDAITAFKKAISINPMDPETQYRLAEVYYETKQFDIALKHATEAEALGYLTDPEFMADLKKKATTE
jgi:tetratricopeptide (TPR) repeat protein